jgi:hypothetical protein
LPILEMKRWRRRFSSRKNRARPPRPLHIQGSVNMLRHACFEWNDHTGFPAMPSSSACTVHLASVFLSRTFRTLLQWLLDSCNCIPFSTASLASCPAVSRSRHPTLPSLRKSPRVTVTPLSRTTRLSPLTEPCPSYSIVEIAL